MGSEAIIWYILIMTTSIATTTKIYDIRPVTLLPAAAAIMIAALIINSQNLLLTLAGPATMLIVFMIMLVTTCLSAKYLADKFSLFLDFAYPTVTLWCYPTLAMFMITTGAYAFMAASNKLLGRGFWSDKLGLTGQDTTTFFFSCFAAMLTFITLQFAASVFKVFAWIVNVSRAHQQLAFQDNAQQNELGDVFELIRNHNEELRENRLKATKINRIALVAMFLIAIFAGSWITFYQPELILYYRAEIQLRTFIEPLSAYETFRHLVEKFPQYRFIDSVYYRMAWIQDRRLNDYEKARQSYENFLERFGFNNVWSDEALTSLVRLSLDKLDNPKMAMHWSGKYLNLHPDGIMAPHMYLYRIRALNRIGTTQLAKEEKEKAIKLFANNKMQLINNEDRLIGLVGFTDALLAETSHAEAPEN